MPSLASPSHPTKPEKNDDHQARQQSLTTSSSIIVQAPAGSGKTELLVQRYLKLLASACDNPRQIIAITFTRKAAAEMRARIRAELQQSTRPAEEHKRTTFELAQQVLARAKEKNWDLDRLISQDTVTTIDAFCRFLVALDPVKANFFTMPDLLEGSEADRFYQKAVSEAILLAQQEGMREKLKELIYIHNNNLHQFQQNFADLLKQRAPLLLAIMKKDNDLQSGIRFLCQELLARTRDCAPEDILAALAEPSQQAVADWQEQQRDGEPPFSPIPSDYNWQEADLAAWQNLSRLLLTSGRLRKRVNKITGFSARTDHKEAMENLLKELAARAEPQPDGHPSPTGEFLYYLARVRSWSDCYQKEELELAEAAAQFFKLASSQLHQLFKNQGKCDYVEIMLAALEVMEQEHAPSLLAERLGYQLRHILVDEFQDTSTGQLRLLEALCRSWDASTPNTLFLVGDPMQSIYAFRQADVRIFNRLWQNRRLGQVALTPLVLSRNFRSQRNLVGWCNNRFTTIFPPVADNIIDSVVHTPAAATHPAADRGIYLLGLERRADSEPDARAVFMPMINEIKRLNKESQSASIAILTPSRNHISGLLPFLQEERLDFNAGQIIPSSANPHIMDLLSLTRALFDWTDEISWYACLRAPWCGLELADLLHISRSQQEEAIWSCLYRLSQAKSSHIKGIGPLQHFVGSVAPAMNKTRRTNWSDLVLFVWRRLGGDRLLVSEQDHHDSELFFSLLQQHSNGALIDLDSLASELADQGAVFENDSRIQLMTIHKSKGLEFDYVFLPMIHRRSRNTTTEILLTTDFHSKQAKREFSLFAIHSPGSPVEEEPGYGMLRQLKREKETQEYRRLFYVACTRAKKRLYLHYLIKYDDQDRVKENPFSADSFADFLRPQIKDELISQAWPLEVSLTDSTQFPLLKRVSQRPPLKPLAAKKDRGAAPLFGWSDPRERAQGLLIHRCLDSLTKMHPKPDELEKEQQRFLAEIRKRQPEYETELSEAGFSESQIKELLGEAFNAVRQTLADKRGRWLLSRRGQSEWQLSRRAESTIRLDRSFVEEGKLWIVDYKTSARLPFTQRELDSFHRQLSLYASALAAINEHPIIIAVYCPQDGYWQEWPYQTQEAVPNQDLAEYEAFTEYGYDE